MLAVSRRLKVQVGTHSVVDLSRSQVHSSCTAMTAPADIIWLNCCTCACLAMDCSVKMGQYGWVSGSQMHCDRYELLRWPFCRLLNSILN